MIMKVLVMFANRSLARTAKSKVNTENLELHILCIKLSKVVLLALECE